MALLVTLLLTLVNISGAEKAKGPKSRYVNGVYLYRVSQQVSDLGLVYFDFGCSSACLILLCLIQQKGQSSLKR